jgi:hypothetical protein
MTEPRVRWGLRLIALGIGLVVLYQVLAAAEIGKFGAPTDIGGGLIPLVGICSGVCGVVMLVTGLLDRRSRRRGQGG